VLHVGYPLGEHMALQFSILNSAFLGAVNFLFAKHVLLQLGTISALSSAFQEAVREFSVRQTRAPSVGNDFCSWLCIPRSCA
jgi:hypothetical protein